MEGLRRAALVLCAVLMLCTVAAAEWDSTGSFDGDMTSSSPVIQPEQSEPSPNENSIQSDDSLWGSYGTHNDRPNVEAPSEKQQELEEAQRAWEENQMQREEAFREAEQVTTEPPGRMRMQKSSPPPGTAPGMTPRPS